MTRTLASFVCLSLTTTAFAQRDLTDIPPADPELERKSFVLPEGFEVNLFAADPQIAKPIQMNFDPQGRLWIAGSSVYPHIKPGEVANDKVLTLEDTDGDGVSDKTTVFADGLLIPTGIAPGDGGVYVANSTRIVHLSDNDGDGKADERRIILSGFGTEDTHHIVHTFQWGPEQLLYFNQSIYIHTHMETPWGVRRLNAGGIWQFRPETFRAEVYARGWVNAWGHAFTKYGQSFATDGAGGEGINHVVPGASYAAAYGSPRILHGLNPGSPKHCGLAVVSGRHFPDDWQGDLITNDFRGHRVCRFKLKPAGSTFLSQEQTEVIKSDHVAFRPIDVSMGPDGALYIADWYNPIIQHGEVDFRDPRRDHTHGRIWRVTHKDRDLVEKPKLADASTEDLVEQLASPEGWTRAQAKRVLKERGPEVLENVKQWSRQLDNTAEGYHQQRLEALWMYQALDVVEPELLTSLLRCHEYRARAAATRVLGHWHDRLPNVLELLSARVADDHPLVRLEAVRAAGGLPQAEAVGIAMRALDGEVDENLDYALWLTARETKPHWIDGVLSGEIDFGGNVSHLVFALKSAGDARTVPALLDRLEAGKIRPGDVPAVANVISENGSPDDLRRLFDSSFRSDDPAVTSAILASLYQATRARKVRPAGTLDALSILLDSPDAEVRRRAIEGSGLWQISSAFYRIAAITSDKDEPLPVRGEAIFAVAALKPTKSLHLLSHLAHSDVEPLGIRRRAIDAITAKRPNEAAAGATELLNHQDIKEADIAGLLTAITSHPTATAQFITALEDRSIPPDVATLALRTINSTGRPHPELSAALAKAAGIESGPTKLSPEEMSAMVQQVQQQGDPAKGEAIYRRHELACMSCHAIGEAGGLVGSNLVSLGATAQPDYIIESLLDPNAKVKEGYNTLVVIDHDGKSYSGIKVRQTDDSLILRDAKNNETSIPLASIDEQANGVSLMPTGLAAKLTDSELVDLVAFLSALGRLEGYKVDKRPIPRKWQVMQPTEAAAHRLRRVSYAAAATEDDPAFTWQTVYSNMAGELPLDEVPVVSVKRRSQSGRDGIAFARSEVDVTETGDYRMTWPSTADLQAWLDGQPLELLLSQPVRLTKGRHRFTFAIDLGEREQGLSFELKPMGGHGGVVRFANGL